MITPATVGCYTFTLTGTCIDDDGGTIVLSPTVEVCVQPQATQADITVDGISESEITICHSVVLSGNDNLQSGEIGCWYYDFQDQFIEITGENCVSNDLTVSLGDLYFEDCKEFTFYYEISNGGCTSTDEITVTFIGQDESVAIESHSDGSSYCTNSLYMNGSNIGCQSTTSDFSFTVLNAGDFATPPTNSGLGISTYATSTTFTFYE